LLTLLAAALAGLLLSLLAALLPLLPLLPLLSLLIAAQLLALVALGQLFQLPLQLLGFAAQHLLLPALLRGLLLVLFLLLGQFLLPFGELFQLLERLVDLLLLLLLAGRFRVIALVLILLGVELEIEEPFHVARAGAATTAAIVLIAERHLDIARRGLGAQQVLQRLLLGGKRILPLGALQFLRGGPHGLHGSFHVLDEASEGIARLGQMAGLHAVGQRLRLIAQLGLHAGQERGVFGVGALGARAFELIPGGRDDFLLPLGDLVPILLAAAVTALLLGLRVIALERLHLDEVDIGRGLGARVLGQGVQAHHV